MKPKSRAKNLILPMVGILFVLAAFSNRAEQSPIGRASNFTTETYFEPPHEQQIKMRLSGAEASPLPGGLLDVKQLRIEMFNVEGKPQLIVRAPQCTYSPFDGVARSAGRLKLKSGDGKFQVEGEGFLWRQGDSSLTISNHVHTVVDLPTLQLSQ